MNKEGRDSRSKLAQISFHSAETLRILQRVLEALGANRVISRTLEQVMMIPQASHPKYTALMKTLIGLARMRRTGNNMCAICEDGRAPGLYFFSCEACDLRVQILAYLVLVILPPVGIASESEGGDSLSISNALTFVKLKLEVK
jgi:hypothetical protein